MPRAIWSGAISFGLVTVPVKLFSAVSRKDVRFHQLHDADGVRIQQKRVCPADGEEVAYDHIVKGYEITPGRYVTITPEDLDALSPHKSRTIDIEEFVALDEIDPIYWESSYYLVPDKAAAKPYALLLQAMTETNRVAIGRFVLRTKEYLAAIRPAGNALALSTMLFADEVVPTDALEELPGKDAEAKPRELAMAKQLVESLAADFEPSKFKDTYRARVLDLIEQKAAGKEIVVQPDSEEVAPVPDLMAALEASLNAARQQAAPKTKAKASARAKAGPGPRRAKAPAKASKS